MDLRRAWELWRGSMKMKVLFITLCCLWGIRFPASFNLFKRNSLIIWSYTFYVARLCSLNMLTIWCIPSGGALQIFVLASAVDKKYQARWYFSIPPNIFPLCTFTLKMTLKMTPKQSNLVVTSPPTHPPKKQKTNNIHKDPHTWSPQNIHFFWKPPIISKFKMLTPNNRPSLRMYVNIRVPPSPGCTIYTWNILQEIQQPLHAI